jgi:hypothetical protein
MRSKDITDGNTYFFVATDNPTRAHLVGRPFTVAYRQAVFRKFRGCATRKPLRFFNEDGVGARASELDELPPELHHWDLLSAEELDAFAEAWKHPAPPPDLPEAPF